MRQTGQRPFFTPTKMVPNGPAGFFHSDCDRVRLRCYNPSLFANQPAIQNAPVPIDVAKPTPGGIWTKKKARRFRFDPGCSKGFGWMEL